MYLELRHLRSLRAIRDTGSLARAAERLHLTQSALSHQVKNLERYFDGQLFFRKSRPLRFTPAGERLLALADRILPEAEATERELAGIAHGRSGRLSIALECHSCVDWLLPVLDRYRPDWPEVELDLSMGYSFHPLPALYRGDLDLVITSDPEQDFGGIRYTPLFDYEMQLAVSPNHPLAARGFVEPQDLAGETLLTYPVCRDRLDIFNRFLDPAGIEPHAVRTAELTVILLQQVASGRGVAALPNWALQEALPKGNLRGLSLGAEGMWRTLYMAVREEDFDRPYVQAFLSLAREVFTEALRGVRIAPHSGEAVEERGKAHH